MAADTNLAVRKWAELLKYEIAQNPTYSRKILSSTHDYEDTAIVHGCEAVDLLIDQVRQGNLDFAFYLRQRNPNLYESDIFAQRQCRANHLLVRCAPALASALALEVLSERAPERAFAFALAAEEVGRAVELGAIRQEARSSFIVAGDAATTALNVLTAVEQYDVHHPQTGLTDNDHPSWSVAHARTILASIDKLYGRSGAKPAYRL